MELNIDFIACIQEDLIKHEKIFNKFSSLNEYIKLNKENILLVNIRSLNANFVKLQVFIESLEIKPFIIVCTETRVLDYYKNFGLEGYNIYYNNSDINITDGVVVYIRDCISEKTEIIKQGRLSLLNSEIYLDNNKKLVISALYRAHDLPKNEFILDLKNFLEQSKNIENHIIIGDFNIDLLDLDILGQEHLNNLLDKGFIPSFQSITRPSVLNPNEGSCIDNVFIKTNFIENNAFKYANLFNDHYPLFLSIKIMSTVRDTQKFVPINYNRLNRFAASQDWYSVLSVRDPNEAINLLIDMIQKCVGIAKEYNYKTKKKSKNLPRSRWITPAIVISCKRKEFLYLLWKKNPDNINIKNEYKNYTKMLDKVIKIAKLMYDRDTIKMHKDNPRKLWNVLNNIIGKKTAKKNDITYIIDNQNQKIYDNVTIANLMNTYFCSIGSELSDRIQIPYNCTLVLPKLNNSSIFISPTDNYEIHSIINKMKLKNGGVDGINMKVIKKLSNYIVDPLVHIINLSIEKSIWPDVLKCADVKPIFKANNRHVISNYRPISLISNFSKIFEKVLYVRILDFVKKSKILSNKQYGFMKNLGTKDALHYISNLIYEKLDKSIPIAVTFLDLAKAFDTVDHKILLDKLYNYGIRGNAYELIASYLQSRKQRVKVNGVLSEFSELKTGVPQGTVLGPLLFILYITDLLEMMPDDVILSFADDTALISTDKSWQLVEFKMNNYLAIISKWLALNKLHLNVAKTVYITFGNYCNSVPPNLNIVINGLNVTRVETCKYLGIHFDYRMTWETHTQFIINKTKYLVFLFYKSSKVMMTETLLMIYYAFFHSIINYGIIAWGGCYPNNLNMLQKLQTKILKIVFNNISLINKKPLKLQQLFAFVSLTYHYDALKDKFINSNSITRNKNLPLPTIHKSVGSKSSIFKATGIYNCLPNELKILRNAKSGKKKLKEWISANV